MEWNRLKIIAMAGLSAIDIAAGLFAWRAIVAPDEGQAVPARAAPAMIPAASAVPLGDATRDDSETLSRPLFSKTRRPSLHAADPQAEALSSPPPAGLKLLAVILFGHDARAFVSSAANTEGKWLGVGDALENWKVESIAAQDIALHQQDDRISVAIEYDGSSGRVAPLPAPAPEKSAKSDETPPAKVVAPESFAAIKDVRRGGH
jgi:hypothetical protein